jgi:hypothetical protein
MVGYWLNSREILQKEPAAQDGSGGGGGKCSLSVVEAALKVLAVISGCLPVILVHQLVVSPRGGVSVAGLQLSFSFATAPAPS